MKRYAPLLLILVLLGSLAVSQTAGAAASNRAAPTFPRLSLRDSTAAEEAEELEAEEEELEFEECEASGEEFEFGEEAEEEEFEFEAEECGEEESKSGSGGSVTAPAPCLVHRAESSITTLPASDQVRLTIRYLTYSPATVAVGLKLKDHKGTLPIEHTTRHMGPKGVLSLTTKLGAAVMERAAKAKEFDVSLHAAGTPGYCGRLLEQHLQVSGGKHRAGASRVYSDPRGR